MQLPKFKINKEEIEFRIKELRKNRITLGALCIVIALIICFIITPLFSTALKNRVTIYVANREIKKGQQVTEQMITENKVGAYGLPINIIKNKKDIIGKYSTIDIIKDTYLLKNMFTAKKIKINEDFNSLNGFNKAISFTINNFAEGLSGKIEPGDIITIISKENENTTIYKELEYLYVTNVTKDDGKEYDAQNLKDESSTPKTITVLCREEQAILISKLEQNKGLHVALTFRGEKEKADIFLEYQNKILEDIYNVNVATESIINKEALINTLEKYDNEKIKLKEEHELEKLREETNIKNNKKNKNDNKKENKKENKKNNNTNNTININSNEIIEESTFNKTEKIDIETETKINYISTNSIIESEENNNEIIYDNNIDIDIEKKLGALIEESILDETNELLK